MIETDTKNRGKNTRSNLGALTGGTTTVAAILPAAATAAAAAEVLASAWGERSGKRH